MRFTIKRKRGRKCMLQTGQEVGNAIKKMEGTYPLRGGYGIY